MAGKKKVTTAKRFGVRYGRTNKEKVSKIEAESRKRHKCPYCNYTSVKRISVGIWGCKKCGSKFSGQAYIPTQRAIKRGVKAE